MYRMLSLQIDSGVTILMTDKELAKYIDRFRDRLAVRSFCCHKMADPRTTLCERTIAKTTVLQQAKRKAKKYLSNEDGLSNDQENRNVGNKNAAKDSKRVKIGWLHFDSREYHQI